VAILVVGAVLVGGLPGGGAPSSSLTPPPSGTAAATGSPAATVAPGTAGPGESPAASAPPSAAPTLPPGPPVGIRVTGAKASSQVKAERGPKYLFDGSPATAWISATGKSEGAWVEVSFAPAAITRIQIWPGWQKSASYYNGYQRPQNVTISFDGGQPVPLLLLDSYSTGGSAQSVDIPPELGVVRATRMRITIADVYPARKTTIADSPARRVAISEIRLFGIPNP